MAAIGLQFSDLFVRNLGRRDGDLRPSRRREPAGPQDDKYSITPRIVTECADAMCVKLYDYFDLRQGKTGRFARGDQAIADELGCQARTVRVHAEHLAGAGWIRIHKHMTESSAHKATEYEVLHNPARKRLNENATTPLRGNRARPRSRLVASGLLTPASHPNVARQTRDTSVENAGDSRTRGLVRLTRYHGQNVERETRDTLGTQEGNGEGDRSILGELDPDGDVADANEEMLDRAPRTTSPQLDDAALERLFAKDESEYLGWSSSMVDEAIAVVLRAFPSAELVAR